MLFDLQGRRKTGIKVIYLGLAILMGGGLVLFGIGSNVNGGFFDALSGSGGGDSEYKKAVQESSKYLAAHPKSPKAYEDLIADRYTYAGAGFDDKTQKFNAKSKAQLKMMIDDWKNYKKVTKKIDLNTASYVVNAYIGEEDGKGATEVQTVVAGLQPNAANYLALMRFALYAGDSRIADASSVKARELATKDQAKEVDREIKNMLKLSKQQNAAIQKQIQEQFANQQSSSSSGGGQIGSPFSGLSPGGSAGGGLTTK
ncbi:MAG: hypothetical protein HY827_05740 [Actinobacteria bacterium]|nr:hypothetical protein [Actinomycetota bacterium]